MFERYFAQPPLSANVREQPTSLKISRGESPQSSIFPFRTTSISDARVVWQLTVFCSDVKATAAGCAEFQHAAVGAIGVASKSGGLNISE